MESTPPQRSGVFHRSYVAALGLCLAFLAGLAALPAAAAPAVRGGSMLDGLQLVGRTATPATTPLESLKLYVEPEGSARAQATAWSDARPNDATLIRRIAEQPQAMWLGEWRPDVRAAVARRVARATHAGRVPVLVAYNVPNRDCGQHSSGGAADAARYRAWIGQIAAGIGSGPAVVILEPDALAGMDCLSRRDRRERIQLLKDAVMQLSALPATALYIDAGNPGWVPAARMAKRLRAVGVGRARGFAVNVAAFETTARSRAYGRAISRRTGGAHFVIDTSRNGAGPSAPGDWCNPGGRALGAFPTTHTGDPLVDAFLWVKRPGESDGVCNGGPPAGTWWPEYALDLARRAAGA
jgi:endoglucanase